MTQWWLWSLIFSPLWCRITQVIQGIPVSEDVSAHHQERNIPLILWWAFYSPLKSLPPAFKQFCLTSDCCCVKVYCSEPCWLYHFLCCGSSCFLYGVSLNILETFGIHLCILSCISFNSCFRPQRGCLQAGRRSETLKGGVTMSTTTPKLLPGPVPSFRFGISFGIYWGPVCVE